MLIVWKYSRSVARLTKRPRGPHAARVFQTSASQSSQYSDEKVVVSQIVFAVCKVKP